MELSQCIGLSRADDVSESHQNNRNYCRFAAGLLLALALFGAMLACQGQPEATATATPDLESADERMDYVRSRIDETNGFILELIAGIYGDAGLFDVCMERLDGVEGQDEQAAFLLSFARPSDRGHDAIADYNRWLANPWTTVDTWDELFEEGLRRVEGLRRTLEEARSELEGLCGPMQPRV